MLRRRCCWWWRSVGSCTSWCWCVALRVKGMRAILSPRATTKLALCMMKMPLLVLVWMLVLLRARVHSRLLLRCSLLLMVVVVVVLPWMWLGSVCRLTTAPLPQHTIIPLYTNCRRAMRLLHTRHSLGRCAYQALLRMRVLLLVRLLLGRVEGLVLWLLMVWLLLLLVGVVL